LELRDLKNERRERKHSKSSTHLRVIWRISTNQKQKKDTIIRVDMKKEVKDSCFYMTRRI